MSRTVLEQRLRLLWIFNKGYYLKSHSLAFNSNKNALFALVNTRMSLKLITRCYKSTTEIRDTVRGTEGLEGRGTGYTLPSRLEGLGERRKFPQRVRGGALAENGFGAF